MNLILISKEHNFLHISNECGDINYTFYDSNGILLDGGLAVEKNRFKNLEDTAKGLIKVFDLIQFNKPYIKLEGLQADNFLELIEEQDYKNMQSKVSEYLKNVDEVEIEI